MARQTTAQNTQTDDTQQQQQQQQQGAQPQMETGSSDLADIAGRVIQTGLEKLDPEVLRWGQTAVASASIMAAPIRRSFKTQPQLTGAGLVALAAGGIMLAIAVSRDMAHTRVPTAKKDIS